MKDKIFYSQDSGSFTPPPPPPPPTSPSGSGYSNQDKASSAAIWALVLGIAAWVLCGLFAAVPAWIVGKKELNAIANGTSSPAGKTMAQIGMCLGIIQTILSILALILVLILLVAGIGLNEFGR